MPHLLRRLAQFDVGTPAGFLHPGLEGLVCLLVLQHRARGFTLLGLAQLGLTAAELCKAIDVKANRWSQYESGERPITLPVAIAICDEYGLSLDWIYRGDPQRLPHELRIKIRKVA